MNTTEAPVELPVAWQGVSERTTQRGRVKPVLTGIPGPLFWHCWKHRPGFKQSLQQRTVTVKRITKGKREVVLWINRHNQTLVETLGFACPVVEKITNNSEAF